MTEPISLLEGLATTRAIRRYLPEPIPEDDLASILWHASRAPSGSNRQAFRFVVLRDGPKATRAKAALGEACRAGRGRRGGGGGGGRAGGGPRAGWAQKRGDDGYDRGSGAAASTPKARMAAT